MNGHRYEIAWAVAGRIFALPDQPSEDDARRFGMVLFTVLEGLEEAGV